MKKVRPQIEALFIATSQEKADRCYKLLKSNKTIKEEMNIIPKFRICDKGESQHEINNNMIIVAYAEYESEFDKIKKEIKSLNQIKHKYLFSDKDDAKHWVKEISDFGFRVFINIKDENTISSFNDIINFDFPGSSSSVQDY